MKVDVALDFLLVLVLLCSSQYSVLLILVLSVDDDLLLCVLCLRNSPDGVATVYDLGFVVDCCTIDPVSNLSRSQTFHP